MEDKKINVLTTNLHKANDGRILAFDRIKQAIVEFYDDFSRIRYVRGVIADEEGVYWFPISTYLDSEMIWIGSVRQPDLLSYDIKRNVFQSFLNPLHKKIEGKRIPYDTIKYEDKILIIARKFCEKSFVFDINRKSFIGFDLVEEGSDEFSEGYIFFGINESMLYFVVYGKNKILRIDIKDILNGERKYEVITFASDVKGVCAYINRDNIYISSHGNPDICVYDSNGNHKIIKGLSEENNDVDYYCKIFTVNKYVIALPRHGHRVLVYDTENDSPNYVELPLLNEKLNQLPLGSFCHEYYYSKEENVIYLFPWEYEYISRLDLDSFKIESFESRIDMKEHLKYLYELIKYREKRSGKVDIQYEGKYGIKLGDYLGLIRNEMIV